METYVTRKRFSDFGQYRDQLRCWDVQAVQLSRGLLSVEFDSFDVGDLVLSQLKFDRDATFRSSRDKDWYAIVVDVSPKRWCGIDLAPDTVLVLAPQRETQVVSHEPWMSIGINVRRETLAEWQAPLAALAEWEPTPEGSILEADRKAVTRFRKWVEVLFGLRAPACKTEDEAAMWVAAIRDRVQWHLLQMLGHHVHATPLSTAHRVARYDLALAALHMIPPEGEPCLSVTDLAQGLGVSRRAVEYAFRSLIGISPAQYILAERLNKVRYHLVTYGVPVTKVAFDHEFNNLGRFAYQYARLFGERPSDTLRTAIAAFTRG